MARQLDTEDFKQSLRDHVAAKGAELFEVYGPRIGWRELTRILEDRTQVRYPTEIVFESAPLLPGEPAHPVPRGDRPEDGFILYVHPLFMTRLDAVAALALYQLVAVNYGEFVSSDDAEAFGAAALGIPVDDYYTALCELADQLGPATCG